MAEQAGWAGCAAGDAIALLLFLTIVMIALEHAISRVYIANMKRLLLTIVKRYGIIPVFLSR